MRTKFLTILCMASFGCSAITDLDDYTVSTDTRDAGDAATDAAVVRCSRGLSLAETRGWTIEFDGWSETFKNQPLTLFVVGTPTGSRDLELLGSALFFDPTAPQEALTLRNTLRPGTGYDVIGFIETNGTGGFQQGADVSFAAEICSDGRTIVEEPAEDTRLDLGEILGGSLFSESAPFILGLDKIKGAHDGKVVELTVIPDTESAVRFYARFDSYPDGRTEPITIASVPFLIPQERYDVRFYADLPGDITGKFDLGDHRWSLSFLATGVGPVYDPDPRINREPPGPPIFTHGSPFDEVTAEQWLVEYD